MARLIREVREDTIKDRMYIQWVTYSPALTVHKWKAVIADRILHTGQRYDISLARAWVSGKGFLKPETKGLVIGQS